MQQAELIELLGISDSYFRKWRAGLGIEPKATYPDDEVEQFTRIKQQLDNGLKLPDAIASITGNPPPSQSGNNFVSAIKKGVGKQLTQQADMAGAALAECFQEQVFDSFLKHLARGKFDRFEQLIESSTFALDAADPMECYLIEAGDDE